MQLHNISSTHRKYAKPRIARGGKRGTYSGRGQKGQKSRSGHKIRPAERDLIQRLPKLRGFGNKPHKMPSLVINLGELERLIGRGVLTLVSPESISRALNLRRSSGRDIKILGDGALSRPITVRGVKVSESARKKIVAAGGKVE